MKVRQWMSDFLHLLASGMGLTQPHRAVQTSLPEAVALIEATEAVAMHEAGFCAESQLPLPVQASPRNPELASKLVAAYWRAALQHVDFNELRKEKNQPLLQLPLHEVANRATEIDPQEQGQVQAEDVDVVIFLWENGPGGKPGKRRHPIMAVPAVQVEKYLAPRTDAAPVLNPAYLTPEPRGDAFQYADVEQANLLLTHALTELASDKTAYSGEISHQ